MKSMLSIALALAFTSSVNAIAQNISEVENAFNASRLVPDVLSSVDFKLLLNLEFPVNGSDGAVTKHRPQHHPTRSVQPSKDANVALMELPSDLLSYHPLPFTVLRLA
jgi:hypothetical protein